MCLSFHQRFVSDGKYLSCAYLYWEMHKHRLKHSLSYVQSPRGKVTFFLGVMLLKMACTLQVFANIAPNARVKPMDMIQARALKGKKADVGLEGTGEA